MLQNYEQQRKVLELEEKRLKQEIGDVESQRQNIEDYIKELQGKQDQASEDTSFWSPIFSSSYCGTRGKSINQYDLSREETELQQLEEKLRNLWDKKDLLSKQNKDL